MNFQLLGQAISKQNCQVQTPLSQPGWVSVHPSKTHDSASSRDTDFTSTPPQKLTLRLPQVCSSMGWGPICLCPGSFYFHLKLQKESLIQKAGEWGLEGWRPFTRSSPSRPLSAAQISPWVPDTAFHPLRVAVRALCLSVQTIPAPPGTAVLMHFQTRGPLCFNPNSL